MTHTFSSNKIRHLIRATMAVIACLLLSLSIVGGKAAADSAVKGPSKLTFTFACIDNTTTLNIVKSPASHSVVVSCASGHSFDYLNYGENNGQRVTAVTVSVNITCPAADTASTILNVPNDLSQKVTIYCDAVAGHDVSGAIIYKHSTTMPSVSQGATQVDTTCPGGQSGTPPQCSAPAQGSGSTQTGISSGDLPQVKANKSAITNVLDVIFGIAGAAALLVMIISGLRLITANGDPNSVTQARGGIVYSVVGLLVILTAFSIVTFVVRGLL